MDTTMDTDPPESAAFRTVGDLLRWCRQAPEGTSVPVAEMARQLEALGTEAETTSEATGHEDDESPELRWSWRVKLFRDDTPAEARLGVQEAAEATGKSVSWIRKKAAAGDLPSRKLGRDLVFLAGELRHWIRESEQVQAAGPMDPPGRHLDMVEGGRS